MIRRTQALRLDLGGNRIIPCAVGAPLEATLMSEGIFARSKPVRIGELSYFTRMVLGVRFR